MTVSSTVGVLPIGAAPDASTAEAPSSARRIERAAASFSMFLLGVHFNLHSKATAGMVLALMLMPVWAPTLRRYRFARLLTALGVFTLIWGYVLSKNAVSDGYAVSSADRTGSVTLFAGTLVGICLVLWARTILSVPRVALWYGLGMLLSAPLGSTQGNPWKFVYGVPVTVFVLALVGLRPRPALGIAALIGLAGLSAVLDCRSYTAALLLAALLMLWDLRPTTSSRQTTWITTAGFVIGLALTLYYMLTSFLVAGYLGEAARERTIAQIETSGSLILGGRPELAATWSLMNFRPSGYGIGVIPGPADILTAKTGMEHIGYSANNGYVEKFMFGGHIELHSVVGDMWAAWGLPGLLIVLFIAILVVRALAVMISQRSAEPVVVMLCCWTAWNLAFSPLLAAQPVLLLAIGLILPVARAHQQHRN